MRQQEQRRACGQAAPQEQGHAGRHGRKSSGGNVAGKVAGEAAWTGKAAGEAVRATK